jgi:hypothetical protein
VSFTFANGLHISSIFAFNQAMKCQLGWNDPMKAHVGHVVHVNF